MKENKYLEFKSEISNTFLKTVSAFANYGEGQIKFGIADDGKAIGLKDPEQACLDIENKINDNISPKPDFTFDVNDRTKVVTLIVHEGAYKPYLYKAKAYKRNDTSTVEIDRIEFNRLVLEGSHQYYEKLKYQKQNLQFDTLEEKFAAILGVAHITKDILKTLDLYTEQNGFNRAAALLADENDFPGIDIARFGKSIDEILDREIVEHVSVFKQYDSAVYLFQKYYQYEKIEGIERKQIELIPEKAFREAVANALIHRTWDINVSIRIAMYGDRIEIMSPGGLPSGLTKEEYLKGQISMLRNPVLGNVFFRLHYIEMFGTGIRRINEAYHSCAIKPVFEVYENSIKVVLPVTDAKPVLTTDEEIVYQIFSSGKQLSSSEISNLSGFRKDKTLRLLKSIVKKNYVKVVGSGRGTKYML
ncbi:MAG: putative DNA binding domain-containing protein [Lachnospiraceae bacterium]|nr:putative DNA binding domain-containing protein [Lachnospiraceae bacterium]